MKPLLDAIIAVTAAAEAAQQRLITRRMAALDLASVVIGLEAANARLRTSIEPSREKADAVGRIYHQARTLGGATLPPPAPAPGPPPVAGSDWTFADGATLHTGRNRSTPLRTGVAAGSFCYPSPDLLPGQTLQLKGGTLSLVGDATVPTVNGDVAGSALDAISARDVIIEVIESEHAVAQNMRTGIRYGFGQPGNRINIQRAIEAAQDGDELQISPGAIYIPGSGDGSTYLEGAMLAVYKGLTIRNIPGRGRWYLAPKGVPYLDGLSGLVIREPSQTYSNAGDSSTANPRKTILIEGFDFFNWGRNGDDLGVKVRSGTGSWANYHASVTFRNFKVGKLPFHPSASGFGGAAENLTFDDGVAYDTGDGINASPGNDHNFYVFARNLAMRGVASLRTRSSQFPFSQNNTMDGHNAKLTFNNAVIEGCAFVCGPEGDSSILVQCKGGGNLVLRGSLLISGARSQTATGGLVYEKEGNNFGGWMYGLEGHSLLVEKNVFINHRPYRAGYDQRAMVYFRPRGHGSQVIPDEISACVIRDNIGMSPVPNSLWVQNAPSVYAGPWGAANSVLPYTAGEKAFSADEKRLLLYRLLAGPIAASGPAATHRFIYPHGSIKRSDALRGLG